MKKISTIILALFLFTGFKAASQRIITGLVTDKADGLVIAGAYIKSLPSNKQTVTDKFGRFSLAIAKEDSQLQVTYIGFKTKLMNLSKLNDYKIILETDEKSLSEVVVVGYGTVAKRSVAGSVSSVVPGPGIEGKVAGIAVRGTSSKTSSLKAKEAISADKDFKIRNQQLNANQLTAGEWNDIDNWDFWRDLMNNQEWSNKQQYWSFYVGNKISIELKDKSQKPLINYEIRAIANGKTVWTAKSNYEGKAQLWPALYTNNKNDFTINIFTPDGQKIYEQEYDKNIRSIKVKLEERAEKIKNLDIMFMVDATGSMGDEIAYLKAELDDIIGKLSNEDKLEVRTGMVFYRDKGDDYLVRNFDFENDFSKVKHNLSKQFAGGGGDFEEAVDEAMDMAINKQKWTSAPNSTKIMFMILDAPPHHDSEKIKSIQESAKQSAAKGVILIPVVASGIDKNTEFLMRFLAMSTNGTYVFLTNDSGIGNDHLKPTTGNYKVEYLNDLMYRLIRKYAGLVNETKDLTNFAPRTREK